MESSFNQYRTNIKFNVKLDQNELRPELKNVQMKNACMGYV